RPGGLSGSTRRHPGDDAALHDGDRTDGPEVSGAVLLAAPKVEAPAAREEGEAGGGVIASGRAMPCVGLGEEVHRMYVGGETVDQVELRLCGAGVDPVEAQMWASLGVEKYTRGQVLIDALNDGTIQRLHASGIAAQERLDGMGDIIRRVAQQDSGILWDQARL